MPGTPTTYSWSPVFIFSAKTINPIRSILPTTFGASLQKPMLTRTYINLAFSFPTAPLAGWKASCLYYLEWRRRRLLSPLFFVYPSLRILRQGEVFKEVCLELIKKVNKTKPTHIVGARKMYWWLDFQLVCALAWVLPTRELGIRWFWNSFRPTTTTSYGRTNLQTSLGLSKRNEDHATIH